MASSEYLRPGRLEELTHLRFMVAVCEPEAPPIAPPLLLLPAPPPMLLLSARSSASEHSFVPAFPRSGIVFEATPTSEPLHATPPAETRKPGFEENLERLRPRLERLIKRRWYEEYDTYELDNLVQAGIVHLWEAYGRDPDTFEARGDGYWYATATAGAKQEVIREFRQHFRQQGTGSSQERRRVEVVISAGELLDRRRKAANGEIDDLDETALSSQTVYSNQTQDIDEADRCIDISRLEALIYTGTDPADHPMISRVLGYMREGTSFLAMARKEQVPPSTIRVTVRRIRQACGASEAARANKRRGYGDSKDKHIRQLHEQGCNGPEIARLIGTQDKFVYRRLRTMQLMEKGRRR